MGENDHQSREWSIDIDQGNNVEEVLEPGLDCCIYRVPNILRRINEEAYSPGFISIGPLHYGRRELLGMEKQKTRFLSKFKERVTAEKLEEFKTYINNQEQHIRDHYAVSSALESSEYVAMILNDAVFIIELFVRNSCGPHDFLLEISQLNIFIRRDLLVLENQVPYFVLDHLYSSAFSNKEGYPSFFVLCLKFFGAMVMFNWSFSEQPQVKHFTDLLRRAVVLEVQPTMQSVGFICGLPCATKLNKSGLEFKGIEGKCLHEIRLEKRKHGKWLS
ncbi:hypothetical protein LWI29_018906 [Acer saccharum]|uniref:Uncharacterized protein n=1 Tax=Acer saccharum TaxID=4024 RepID=A0AA39S4E4_ACESA|nr:hypothetical protein LWI29_018906 [Acer saccharum]